MIREECKQQDAAIKLTDSEPLRNGSGFWLHPYFLGQSLVTQKQKQNPKLQYRDAGSKNMVISQALVRKTECIQSQKVKFVHL